MQPIAYNNYSVHNISNLAKMAQIGDKKAISAIISYFEPYIKSRALHYSKIGCDYDDLVQEGMFALINSIRAYKSDLASFKTFAIICINRRQLSAISSIRKQLSVSIDDEPNNLKDDENLSFSELISDKAAVDPEFAVINKETIELIWQNIESLLSKFELDVFVLYLNGFTYESMAVKLNTTPKSVDNALQRVKRKLKAAFLSKKI